MKHTGQNYMINRKIKELADKNQKGYVEPEENAPSTPETPSTPDNPSTPDTPSTPDNPGQTEDPQTAPKSFAIKISDDKNVVVEGVTLKINDETIGVTDESGIAEVSLENGTYEITASKEGYDTRETQITVSSNVSQIAFKIYPEGQSPLETPEDPTYE